MNNFPIPFPPINNNNYFFNIIEEINKLNERITKLEEKLNKEQKDYLKKDDNYYMI
ncbi:MAG: hypothetical protein IKF47_01750 [Bacilli bacterium]|nr:hypothetical protein [Bacilli bacterium]